MSWLKRSWQARRAQPKGRRAQEVASVIESRQLSLALAAQKEVSFFCRHPQLTSWRLNPAIRDWPSRFSHLAQLLHRFLPARNSIRPDRRKVFGKFSSNRSASSSSSASQPVKARPGRKERISVQSYLNQVKHIIHLLGEHIMLLLLAEQRFHYNPLRAKR